jgi:hypothetical protein
MNKPWQPYAQHILDAIAKIQRIQARGDLTQDEVLYDATLRNLQTLSEATQLLPEEKKIACPTIPWPEIVMFFLEIILASIVLPIWPGKRDERERASSLRLVRHAWLMVQHSALRDAV